MALRSREMSMVFLGLSADIARKFTRLQYRRGRPALATRQRGVDIDPGAMGMQIPVRALTPLLNVAWYWD
jgi:hypothetical protein